MPADLRFRTAWQIDAEPLAVRAALADLRAYGKASARLRAEADDQRITMARLRFDADRRARGAPARGGVSSAP